MGIMRGSHHFVDIGHGAVSTRDILYTNGMWPCVGVAVLNREAGTALLLHASAAEDAANTLPELLPLMGASALEAVIAGGDASSGSLGTLMQVLAILDEHHVPVVAQRWNSGSIDSLAVDPRSGIIY